MKTYWQLLDLLPCETEKCLMYPVCKHKRHIDCTKLRDFYTEVHESAMAHDFTTKLQTDKTAWEVMHRKFSKLQAISIDKIEAVTI